MGTLIGFIFGGGFVIALSALLNVKPQRPSVEIPEKHWPQYCDDISAGVRAGLSISESTWLAANSLPQFLQNRFEEARLDCTNGISFSRKLADLNVELDNPTFARIAHLITTALSQNAGAVASLLNEFAQNLRTDIALVNEIAGKQAVTKVSAKVAAFAPIVVLLLTSTRSTVRDAFLTTSGLIVIAGAMSVTLFSYLLMRSISEIKVLNAR